MQALAVPETPAKVLDVTLYTRTLVGEDVSMKPKMKQPQTEATEVEAHEAARRWSRENRRSTTARRIMGRATVGRSGYRHGRRKSMAEAGAGRFGRRRRPHPKIRRARLGGLEVKEAGRFVGCSMA